MYVGTYVDLIMKTVLVFILITAIEYLTVIFCRLAFSARSRPFVKITAGRGFLDLRIF